MAEGDGQLAGAGKFFRVLIEGAKSRSGVLGIGLGILAIIVLFVVRPLISAKAEYGFVITLGVIVIVGILISVIAYMSGQSRTKGTSWQREVPRLDIPGDSLRRMESLLGRIRDAASQALRDFDSKIVDTDVRANIFFADYRKQIPDCPFVLRMPYPELRKNMIRPDEWALEFLPYQGKTGEVFATGDRTATSNYRSGITDEQRRLVEPKLKWIESFPLKAPDSQVTLAVLNLDGLNRPFQDSWRNELEKKVEPLIKELSKDLAALPRVKLAILRPQ
ncbi:MAG TPA: DUF308 domain-containing protein [Planctomycetota bacterium]|nr:DUF308 domain-containing protein [Planctomycetota bacterium]